jgi:hypothetical protein
MAPDLDRFLHKYGMSKAISVGAKFGPHLCHCHWPGIEVEFKNFSLLDEVATLFCDPLPDHRAAVLNRWPPLFKNGQNSSAYFFD